MPVTSSAKKALRRDQRRNEVNSRMRISLRASIKDFEASPAADKLPQLCSVIDRAAKKNIIHTNKAARLKSRFSQMVKPVEKKSKKTGTKTKKKESK